MAMAHDEVTARLRDCPGWQAQGDALVRRFTFPSFPDAIVFATRLAFDAEAQRSSSGSADSLPQGDGDLEHAQRRGRDRKRLHGCRAVPTAAAAGVAGAR